MKDIKPRGTQNKKKIFTKEIREKYVNMILSKKTPVSEVVSKLSLWKFIQ